MFNSPLGPVLRPDFASVSNYGHPQQLCKFIFDHMIKNIPYCRLNATHGPKNGHFPIAATDPGGLIRETANRNNNITQQALMTLGRQTGRTPALAP
jgi:hypothetical protein